MFVKAWASKRGVKRSDSGTLSSYAWIILSIFYLQYIGMIPSLQQITPNDGQDKKKNRYDESQHITYDELLKKIYESELKCYYCKKDLILMYKNKNEKNQWSLERFDNNLGHYESNTCISCLGCNLQRRNENHEYFKQSKQLKVTKR